MKFTPYLTALNMSNSEKSSSLAPAQAEETRKTIELEIAKNETQKLGLETQLALLAMSYPLDMTAVRVAQDKLDHNARALKKLNELREGLLPAA